MIAAEEIVAALESFADEKQRQNLMRFFKTGKGDYGEGDCFLGLKVPQTRAVVKEARLEVPLGEIEKLLDSRWHEARLAGFLLLVDEMLITLPKSKDTPMTHASRRDELAEFYLLHARRANNWDLVDMTCPKILGNWLLYPGADGNLPDRAILDKLVASDNLWEQRIGIVATWKLIQKGQFDDTLRLAEKLLDHTHDLIHKATGWMLREVGKKDMDVLRDFLHEHSSRMPRTSLRYAIEKMKPSERKYWLDVPRSLK